MFRNCRFCLLLYLLVCLFSAADLRGDVTGSVLGVVTDPTGAVIQNAKVTVTNLETNLIQETTTDASGQYRILSLPAGRYRVEASIVGFQKFVATDVVLTVNEQRRVDIALQVGTTVQETTVVASAVQVIKRLGQIGNKYATTHGYIRSFRTFACNEVKR